MKLAMNPNYLNPIVYKIPCPFNFKSLRYNPFINRKTSKFHITSTIIPRKTLKSSLRYESMTSSPSPSPSPSPCCVVLNEKIVVTDKERSIFELLLNVVCHFNLETQLRVAGGWVRDKLLGKDCYDIDIALDNMLGNDFCQKINEYCVSHTGDKEQKFGKIASNPEKSKHLETATMRIFDMWIDFVNLRAEDYCENSRIPTMRFGTAKEDAFRRDLTINSLFYNINTRAIEDFTERGIEDLRNGRIVTPLPAKETFLDDPLRVLRAIRFAARFGFVLDDELKRAAACDDVRVAIADKISRERVGIEIDKMISDSRPVIAMTYICELQLFSVVFTLPLEHEPATMEGYERLCLASVGATWDLIQSIKTYSFSNAEKRYSLYASLFLPLRKIVYKDRKGKMIPVVDYIFLNSLKLKVDDALKVINTHNAAEKFIPLIPYLIADDDNIDVGEMYWIKEIIDVPAISKLRIFTGSLLDEMKGLWRVALLMSTLLYHPGIYLTYDAGISNKHLDVLNKRLELFVKIDDVISRMGLDRIWETKALVNGKVIMEVLELDKGGPVVSEWQQKLRQWQLANPNGTLEDCLDWMRQTLNHKRVKIE